MLFMRTKSTVKLACIVLTQFFFCLSDLNDLNSSVSSASQSLLNASKVDIMWLESGIDNLLPVYYAYCLAVITEGIYDNSYALVFGI